MSNHEAEVFNLTEALERVEGDLDLLKEGAVSNFAAYAATAASFTLEKMGRQQDLTDSAATLSMLKRELELLSFALAALKEKEAA
jgi:hypothetical protein